jgi:hypothetical protein
MYVTGDTYEGTFVEGLRTGRVSGFGGDSVLVSSHTFVKVKGFHDLKELSSKDVKYVKHVTIVYNCFKTC